MSAHRALECCWSVLGIYWFFSALGTKKTAVGESSAIRVFRLSILVVTLSLELTDWLRIGKLGKRFVPNIPSLVWLGVGLTAAGVGLAIWARRSLGRNWSDRVVLKVDHELIRSGPYRYLRHPIYGGVLLAVSGTALAIGEWRGVAALVLLGINYSVKARKEEKILAAQFGDTFAEHRRRTWFVLPGL